MTTTAKGTLDLTDWVETAITEPAGQAKQASACAQVAFTGTLEGSGRSDWLLTYPADGPAYFVGTQRFDGKLDSRVGSVVLHVQGTFDEAGAHVTWSVVPGSGSGELSGLNGTGGYDNADYTLEFSFV